MAEQNWRDRIANTMMMSDPEVAQMMLDAASGNNVPVPAPMPMPDPRGQAYRNAQRTYQPVLDNYNEFMSQHKKVPLMAYPANPAVGDQRDSITRTLMNIARPPPTTPPPPPQMPQMRPQMQMPQMPPPGAPAQGMPMPIGAPPQPMPLSPGMTPMPAPMAGTPGLPPSSPVAPPPSPQLPPMGGQQGV